MIYPALVSGGSLHIINEERADGWREAGEYFEREGIDYLKIVPSHLKGWRARRREASDAAKETGGGGEASPWDWVEGWEKAGEERGVVETRRGRSRFEIVNHYGPTETTVGSSDIRSEREKEASSRCDDALGRALGNSRMYVLDEEMEPVPRGVAGELFIGGAGVGRGYLGRAELTADRFVPNPYAADREEGWDDVGERLYRTGDRVRYLEDGNLEFFGAGG